MVRRIAFLSGLILGSGLCAWALGSALIYFFTGKMPAIVVDVEKGIAVDLFDPKARYKTSPGMDKGITSMFRGENAPETGA
jgi:hypothetical protein